MLEYYFKQYLEYLSIYRASGTVRFTQSHSRNILSYFGKSRDPTSIPHSEIIDYIFHLQSQKLTNNTINKRVDLLKRVCKFYDLKCQFYDIPKLKEKFVTFGNLDNDKENNVRLNLKLLSLRDQVLFLILIDTGCRVTELINIKIENIDFSMRSIYLEITKTNHPRYVNFSPNTLSILKRFISKRNHGYLFLNPSTGEQMTISAVEHIFKRFRERFKIKYKISPHRLRHTLLTNLYFSGAPLTYISELAGHSSVDTTKRYIHSDRALNLKIYDKYTKK